MTGLVTLFVWIYYKLGIEAIRPDVLDGGFFTMLYYSVVTFTTLGFGWIWRDITPQTTGATIVVMIEVIIIGYVMFGGLISIFATKIARRT